MFNFINYPSVLNLNGGKFLLKHGRLSGKLEKSYWSQKSLNYKSPIYPVGLKFIRLDKRDLWYIYLVFKIIKGSNGG